MDFLAGGDLQDLSDRGWSLRKKLGIFLEVLRGVAFAHHVGVIHRDIKPANIVLTAQHTAVLTDFDIADIKFAATKSMQSASLGTPQFAAPEQLASKSLKAEPSADIYSLGKLLYFMVTETAPPLGSTENDWEPAYLRMIEQPELRHIVALAIRDDPAHRFQSVTEIVTLTENAIARLREGGSFASPSSAPKPSLSGADIDDMVSDVAALHQPPVASQPAPTSDGVAGRSTWVAGLCIGAAGLLFFMALVVVSLYGVEVPPDSRFLAAVVLALTLAFSAGFLGGSASARGNIPLAVAHEHPIHFAVTGGVATFVVVMALAYLMYV